MVRFANAAFMRILFSLFACITLAGGAVTAGPSGVTTIRALRLENNRAIASRNPALVLKSWSPNIRLIVSNGKVYSGSAFLLRSYQGDEFKDKTFIEYLRTPLKITISENGAAAAEYGKWITLYKVRKPVESGTYLASWRKNRGTWKIVYEAYVSLNLQPVP